MYEIYCKLRDEKGLKDADVSKATGIPQSTFSEWKKGRSKPKGEKLQKIADFFEVSVDYLQTGKEKTIKSRFSITLRHLRKSAGLTQEELAEIFNISRSTVAMYEQGFREPDIETLELIADYFTIDMDFLFGRTDITDKMGEREAKPSMTLNELFNHFTDKSIRCEIEVQGIQISATILELDERFNKLFVCAGIKEWKFSSGMLFIQME